MINFSQNFYSVSLPEVKDAAPPVESPGGYDGQFYAQVALDPLLVRKEELKNAIDLPFYRSKRIGVPLLAYVLGWGRVDLILQVYALLNFVFWIILFFLIYRQIVMNRPRDFLLAISILWSLGVYISMARALTDLPALTFSAVILFCNRSRWLSLFSFAFGILCKETALFSTPAVWEPQSKRMWKNIFSTVVVIIPIVLWGIYVQRQLPFSYQGESLLVYPGTGFIKGFMADWDQLILAPAFKVFIFYILNILLRLSFVVQILYFLLKPRWGSVFYRFGIGFAVLGIFLNHFAWGDYFEYPRMLLPLTFAFNFLLYEYERGSRFKILYILGNIQIFVTIYFLCTGGQ